MLKLISSHHARRGRACPNKSRHGMTLIELLIVVAIIGMLAAIGVPMLGSVGDNARAEALAANVRYIQGTILEKAATHGAPLAPSGFPNAVDPNWFRGSSLPQHSLAQRIMFVDTVSDPEDIMYPATKAYDPSDPAAPNTWYNSTNGIFRALVPPQDTDAQTIDLFNQVNKTGVTTLGQTSD